MTLDHNENHDETGKFTFSNGTHVSKAGPIEYSKSLKEYEQDSESEYEGAHCFFKEELQGKSIKCKTPTGEINAQFTGSTWRELKRDMKQDALKREILPLIPDIIANGKYRYEKSYKDRSDGTTGFHVYEKRVNTTKGAKSAIVDVAIRPLKNPEYPVYSLVHEESNRYRIRKEKESASSADSGRSPRDDKAQINDIVSDSSLSEIYEIVNIRINEEEEGDQMHREHFAFDSSPSHRYKDQNGYLHVDVSNITKEQVVPYYGREIPGWQELGLERDKIYYMYRPGEEIKKAAETFNGIPLAFEHHAMSADDLPKEYIIGTVGTEGRYDPPYLKNSLVITDGEAIDAVERGEYRELSAAYLYKPVMKSGMFQGEHYDGVMTSLAGNHVALVKEGRAGHDVVVEDAMPEGLGAAAAPVKNFRKERALVMDKKTMRRIHRVMAYDAMPETEGMNVNLTAFMNAIQVIEAIKQGINPRSLGFDLDKKASVDDIVKVFFGSEDPAKQEGLREQLAGIMGKSEGMNEDEDPEDDDFEETQEPDDVPVKKEPEEKETPVEDEDEEEQPEEDVSRESDLDKMSHENSPFEDNPVSDEDKEEFKEPFEDDLEKDPADLPPEGEEDPEEEPVEDEEGDLPGEPDMKDDEPEEDYSDAMGAVGLDADDPEASKSFAEGVRYAKKLMKEHEDEENGPVHDEDHAELGKMLKMKKALDEKIEKAKAEMKEHYRAINKAAMDCRPVLGELRDPLAFDSAEQIYKKALVALGMDVKGVHPSAYAAMLKFARAHKEGVPFGRTAMDSASVKDTAGKRALDALKRINLG